MIILYDCNILTKYFLSLPDIKKGGKPKVFLPIIQRVFFANTMFTAEEQAG